MSQENVEVMRHAVEAWNAHDRDAWLSYLALDVEWIPAGPAAVERASYRGRGEVARWYDAMWTRWALFDCSESEVRDAGDSVVWLGHATIRGRASQVELDQAWAIHGLFAERKIVRCQTFLRWAEALKAVGLEE
jgi:ketosteroid isomerase-like protein